MKIFLSIFLLLFSNLFLYAKKIDISQMDINNEKDIKTIVNHYSKKPDHWFVANNSFLIIFEDKKTHKDKLTHVSSKVKRIRPSKSKVINLKTGKVNEYPHYTGFPLKNNFYDIDAILFHDFNKKIKQSALFIFHSGDVKYMRARFVPRRIKSPNLEPCYNAKIFSSVYFSTSGSFFDYKHITWDKLNLKGANNETWQPYGITNYCGITLDAELSQGKSMIFLEPNTLAPIENIKYPTYGSFDGQHLGYEEYSKIKEKMKRKALLVLRPQMLNAQKFIDEQERLFNQAYEKEKKEQKQSRIYTSGRVAYQPQKKTVETAYSRCMSNAPEKTRLSYEIAYKSGAKPTDGTWSGTYRELLKAEENRCKLLYR